MHNKVNKLCIFWKPLWHKRMLKPSNKNILVWFAEHYFWYWIWVNGIIFIVKMFVPNIIMSENLYFIMMTSQVVVGFLQFIFVIKKYAINVMNTIFYQMLITQWQTRCWILNILNSNIEQRCHDWPEVHQIRMQTHACIKQPAQKYGEMNQ